MRKSAFLKAQKHSPVNKSSTVERMMKVNVEIDCTPIEARQFFGFPNVEPMQAAMMSKIERRLVEEVDRFSPDALMRSWLSVFPQNAETIRRMFAGMMGQSKQE